MALANFYNGRVNADLKFVLQEDSLEKVEVIVVRGAHKCNNYIKLFWHGMRFEKILVRGALVPLLYNEMLRVRTSYFTNTSQYLSTEIDENLHLKRGCSYDGIWTTTLTEIIRPTYRYFTDTATYWASIPLTLGLYDQLIMKFPEILEALNAPSDFPEEDKATIPLFRRVSLIKPNQADEYFLTKEEVERDPSFTVCSESTYCDLLFISRSQSRLAHKYDDTMGGKDNPIPLGGDDNIPLILFPQMLQHSDGTAIEMPTHVYFKETALRPSTTDVCAHFAFRYYRNRIRHYAEDSVYDVSAGIYATDFVRSEAETFQILISETLFQLGYTCFSPTMDYIREVLADVSPHSPYAIAMNSLNYPTAHDEITTKRLRVLDAMYAKFARLYLKFPTY